MTYAKSVLIAIDQLGNAIAGGNPDCTISGRIGYYHSISVVPYLWYWSVLAFIVDITFYPFDGKGHCRQAYEKEQLNEFYELNSFKLLALFVLTLIVLGSCLIMCPLFWIIYGVKTFINRILM